ncbi:uncharacterized protein [Montipora foliosa]|uniref:uncharacterized protein isoform X2 n=1 Tax=Montipora foliosa TaxID=591990 RepID=UPI0035F12736
MDTIGLKIFLKAVRLALAILLSYALVKETSALREVGGGVRYANFILHKFVYLNITPVRKRLVQRVIQCALSCLDTLPCFSFNLAAFQDSNDKLLCEHLPSDKYNNSDQFGVSKVFHHFSILSPCSSWSCNGNGKCVALYAENSYVCVCKTGFFGENCENAGRLQETTDPIAFFPLNGAYGTKEINNRSMPGNPTGVTLSQGPDGKDAGSYEFSGTPNSFIEFPNSDGGPLDVNGGSMTMLCWIYPTGEAGPLFNYERSGAWGVHLWNIGNNELFVHFTRRDYLPTNVLAGGSLPRNTWHLVGASYDVSTGLAKLWVNAHVVRTLNIGAGINLATQDSVRMGVRIGDGRYYKGRIAQMQVYNEALSAKQIQEIKQRTPVA